MAYNMLQRTLVVYYPRDFRLQQVAFDNDYFIKSTTFAHLQILNGARMYYLFHHITPHLKSLHWLKITQRI